MASEDGRADEIVIVRRRGGTDDDHHHGGVWKIAYADFMTAMMAFFLVMWLINASNTETKSSIASYFNPVKLTDSVSRKRGLYDIDEKSNAAKKSETNGRDSAPAEKQAVDKTRSSNTPLGTPKQPAQEMAPRRDETLSSEPKVDGDGSTGEAFRDPFNPLASARQLVQQLPDPVNIESGRAASKPRESDGQNIEPHPRVLEKAQRIHREVESAIKSLGLSSGPGLDVTLEDDTIVLSLTDTSTFGMFAIGSPKPSNDLVKLIEAITPTVAKNSGQLIIRGHTDSRPFPGATGNNNWRLAMARAEAVYSMLIQSRVDDARFERIEAHADRKPKDPSKPEAAINRRIDILLRPTGP